MTTKGKVVVIDNNDSNRQSLTELLEKEGYEVTAIADGDMGYLTVLKHRPSCVIIDTVLPGLDGLEISAKIRKESSLNQVKILVHSEKPYDYDKRRAEAFGADAFIPKPIKDKNEFIRKVNQLIQNDIFVEFWGVRGTLPVPGKNSIRYGGNTSCVSVEIPSAPLMVFDAGSGIRPLGDSILPNRSFHLDAHIFISHSHWDHVNALPFFSPLYIPGNNITISGPANLDISVDQMISDQMSSIYFPITVNELGATISYQNLHQGHFEVGEIKVSTFLLRHPGNCLGYRLDYKGRSVSYITDNELFPEQYPQYSRKYFESLAEFVEGTDILITDSTYSENEYKSKVGWGHSCIPEVVKLAAEAKVKNYCLFHHDPCQTDDDIDNKLDEAKAHMEKEKGDPDVCTAPQEGLKIKI